jgi:Phosphotransferase enzyme family
VAACGLPDTLVHGDVHPGNFRGGGGAPLSLLDWGDCSVGNPLLDGAGFLGRISADEVPAVRAHWHALWRAAVPGSAPERAATLLQPVSVARGAVVYQGFLDAIEPSEHPYHQGDPLRCLRDAAQSLAAGS